MVVLSSVYTGRAARPGVSRRVATRETRSASAAGTRRRIPLLAPVSKSDHKRIPEKVTGPARVFLVQVVVLSVSTCLHYGLVSGPGTPPLYRSLSYIATIYIIPLYI